MQAFFISSQVQVKYAPLLIITIQVLNQLSAYISNASQLSRQFFLPLFKCKSIVKAIFHHFFNASQLSRQFFVFISRASQLSNKFSSITSLMSSNFLQLASQLSSIFFNLHVISQSKGSPLKKT